MTSFISIVNWAQHQHYKDRNPPWIKLHRELLTSETWVSSSNEDRVLAIAIMMLAAECGNRVPANTRYIQRRAYLEKEPDLSGLIALKFIEIIEENDVASKPQASARPESENRDREREQKEEEDSVADATGAVAPLSPTAFDLKAAVFSSGVALLMAAGSNERNARSMIGRWCKDYGAPATLDALASATAQAVPDPIPWIQKRFANGRSSNTLRGNRPEPSLDFVRQANADIEAERGSSEDYRRIGAALPAIRAN